MVLTAGMVFRRINRPSPEIVAAFREFGVATVHEAMGRSNLMEPEIRPVCQGLTLVGPALTVLCHVGDNLMVHKAMEVAQPGDVLVVAAQGHRRAGGLWGDLLTISAKARGVAGLVVDGAVRDAAALREMRFPVWTRDISAGGTVKETLGSLNVPLCCGGVTVWPGDLVLADDDGVVVVPRADAGEVLAKAREREAKEQALRPRLERGELLYDLFGLREVLQKKGAVEIDEAYDDYINRYRSSNQPST